MRAIELLQFHIDNLFQLEGVELLLEEELELHTPLSKATAGKWMEVIWKLLLADYPAPEKHEATGKIWSPQSEKDPYCT